MSRRPALRNRMTEAASPRPTEGSLDPSAACQVASLSGAAAPAFGDSAVDWKGKRKVAITAL